MVDTALRAMVDNALGAKWSGGHMVDRALGAKWYVVLQASLTITHAPNVLSILDATCRAARSSLLGDDAVEDNYLIRSDIYIEIRIYGSS